jgi:hypothetical protein
MKILTRIRTSAMKAPLRPEICLKTTQNKSQNFLSGLLRFSLLIHQRAGTPLPGRRFPWPAVALCEGGSAKAVPL